MLLDSGGCLTNSSVRQDVGLFCYGQIAWDDGPSSSRTVSETGPGLYGGQCYVTSYITTVLIYAIINGK